MDIREELRNRALLVEPVLRDYMTSPNPKIQEMLQHTIKAGGKRVRPALVMLACEAVGQDPKEILPAAASVELLHSFTLVHDDIMDHDLERRGKPTVHALWGMELGIVVGDTIYSKAFESLLDLSDKGLEPEKVIESLTTLTWANSQLQEGQFMDMFFAQRDDVGEAEYMDMIEKKTGVLMQASLLIGAICGGASSKQKESLGEFGRLIGVAFQIQDDILDLTADESKLGKPVGSDVLEGKRSLISIHALQNLPDEQKARLLSILDKQDNPEDIGEAMELFSQAGSIQYARDKTHELASQAKKELEALPEGEAIQVLNSIADYIINRNH